MSYTQQRFPNFENEFPEPPLWLVWQAYAMWDRETRSHVYDGEGQVRHVYTLQKAKKMVSPYGSSAFRTDWAIYHWEDNKYVLQYEGKQDEAKSANALFQERVPGGQFKPREIDPVAVEKAIASIIGV